MNQLYIDNYPYLPPFSFLGILIFLGGLLILISHKKYIYSYHQGYLIALCSIIDLCFLAYGCRYILTLYLGDYTNQNSKLPLYILGGSLIFKLILNLIFIIYVIKYYYLNDIRFR